MVEKAFVSSTFKDLEDHRLYVIEALRKCGFHVDPMENWVASKDAPKQFSQDRVKDCDLFILLVGFRRGTIPEGEKMSITQLEYKAASELGIDILVFMLKDDAPWQRQYDELDRDMGIKQWRQELEKVKGVGYFTQDPRTIEIEPALYRRLVEKTKNFKVDRDQEIIKLAQADKIQQDYSKKVASLQIEYESKREEAIRTRDAITMLYLLREYNAKLREIKEHYNIDMGFLER